MSSNHRNEHQIVVRVAAPANLSADEVTKLLQRLIDCGLSDAADTVNEGEGGDIKAAEASLDLNICAPKIDETFPMVQAINVLKAQYEYVHPEWPRANWQHEVANHDTELGYWEWVTHQIEADHGGEQ